MFIDQTLYTGRPAEKRTEREERCYELLDSLQLPYWRADHDEAASIEVCHGVEQVLGCLVCKNLVLTNRQQTEFYLLLMPGEKPFKTKILSKQIGAARLSFATAEQMGRLLDVTPGSVSLLALEHDKKRLIRLLVDKDLLDYEYVGCHPCRNTSTLKLKMQDVLEVIFPAVHHTPKFVELPWEIPEE